MFMVAIFGYLCYHKIAIKYKKFVIFENEEIMEQTYRIEKKQINQDPDSVEFFLQHNAANSLAASAHIHDAIELLYVREGSYTAYANDVQYALKAGDLILFCANTIHRVVTGNASANSYYVIKVQPTALLNLVGARQGVGYALRFTLNRPEQNCLWTREQLETDSKILPVLRSLICEWETQALGHRAIMKLKIVELLLWIMREDAAPQTDLADNDMCALIYRAMAYVQSHFSSEIDEQELAAMLGISYGYFSRSFHRITGLRFRQYLNFVRIDRAEQMLLTTNHSVTQIASQCGYPNVSYFISVYRQRKGKTPYQASRIGPV